MRRNPRYTQRVFPFVERRRLRQRQFRALIILSTALPIAVFIAASKPAQFHIAQSLTHSRWSLQTALGHPPARAELDADWRARRAHDIVSARSSLRKTYAEYGSPMRRVLDRAGLDPERACLRWGNFDKTLWLPSTVFVPDDSGRSYRLRPNTRSVWLRNPRLKNGQLAFFPIPSSPDLPQLLEGTDTVVIPNSEQSTNSWGLRGPEPDEGAMLRGIILGDSFMQGLFVADHETPAECLKRELTRARNSPTEILNTGCLGYSTEQEFHTLTEFADRFHPSFVILSLFANDFGDQFEVLKGQANWTEGQYWIERIDAFCRQRNLLCIAVAVPWVDHTMENRRTESYPAPLARLVSNTSIHYLDPTEAFTAEYLKYRSLNPTALPTQNPLFNTHIADGHFSPLGCQLWAQVVAARFQLLRANQAEPGAR
jgi:lysophospholipase L1-like esterase